MSEKIKILIADDAKDTRDSVKKILLFEENIEIVGEANNGEEAVNLADSLKPDIILMDINMPVLDGISATYQITMRVPESAVIILSVQGEQEYLRKAMSAGARDYLVKPFSADELLNAIKRVKEFQEKRKPVFVPTTAVPEVPKNKIIAIFGTKGGVGKSLIATNLAISLQAETKQKVVIVDLDLQFGDIAIMLDLKPKYTISDLAPSIEKMDVETIENYLVKHKTSEVRVLPAPLKPAYAEVVTPESIGKILNMLKDIYNYVIVDTPSTFADVVLTALDIADIILLIATLDVPTIKNAQLSLETMRSLNYPPEKIKLILNRSDSQTGLKLQDLEGTLNCKASCFIPSDGKLVIPSVNRGIPFVTTDPQAPISKSLFELAKMLTVEVKPAKKEETKPSFARVLKPIFSKK